MPKSGWLAIGDDYGVAPGIERMRGGGISCRRSIGRDTAKVSRSHPKPAGDYANKRGMTIYCNREYRSRLASGFLSGIFYFPIRLQILLFVHAVSRSFPVRPFLCLACGSYVL
jgi:hypothetical protein